MRNFFVPILFALSLVCLSGCGQTPVKGTVTFSDGSPLTVGNVIFENDQHTYKGTINKDGTFNMGMLKDGEGIPPGEYRVAVVAVDPASEGEGQEPRLLTDEKYVSSRTSEITYTVQKAMDIKLTVEKPQPK